MHIHIYIYTYTYIHTYIHAYIYFFLFDPASLPYKYLVFAPEVDRRSSRDFEWTDL